MDLNAVVNANVPILCIDTCSLLDVIRDPTRSNLTVSSLLEAIKLKDFALSSRLVCLMAEQVETEINDNIQDVEIEAKNKLSKLKQTVMKIGELSTVLGSSSTANLAHFDDHVDRAKIVLDDWRTKFETVIPTSSVAQKALRRVVKAIPPSKRGKESTKDCLVYETYLEVAGLIRGKGSTVPIVFLSANTKEYCKEGGALIEQIDVEMSSCQLEFAFQMGHARSLLGL